MNQPNELILILQAGACLVDTSGSNPAPDLRSILLLRLQQYHTRLEQQFNLDCIDTLQAAQRETANQALCVLERVQRILIGNDGFLPSETGKTLLGTRDLAELRTLLSIVIRWGLDLLLEGLAWPLGLITGERQPTDDGIIVGDYEQLSSFTYRLLSLLFPNASNGHLQQTPITATLLNRHLPDLLKSAIALGWLPKSSSIALIPTQDEIRTGVIRLLSLLSSSESMTALGAILATVPAPPHHVKKTCSCLMSRQLLRPDGVIGLCHVVFGEGSNANTSAPLEKLDHFARVLCLVPAKLDALEYYETIIPRIVTILSDDQAPSVYIRASAFSLSRLLLSSNDPSRSLLASSVLLPILHDPLLRCTVGPESSERTGSRNSLTLSPKEALSTLQLLLINSDHSPTFISSILTPVVPSLYCLNYQLSRLKTADPLLTASLHSLIVTWGRVATKQEGVRILWEIVCGEGGDWETALGEIKRVKRSEPIPTLSLITPEYLRQTGDGEQLDPNANLLDLRPDPVHFAHFLESLIRHDISSELFLRLLEAYRDLKSRADSDPMRALLYLQLIIQLQSQTINSSTLLGQPSTILSFIKHVLYSAASPSHPAPLSRDRSKATDLRFVSDNNTTSLDSDDSDDDLTVITTQGDEEVLETSLNLLLAVLEAHSDLSVKTPDLNDIFTLLEPIASDMSNKLRPLAMEARLVITARLASTSSDDLSKRRGGHIDETPNQAYQKALKLLQDPILPVRAHGLVLLRQLVSSRSGECASLDPALVPGILSVFLQSLQDEDSYIFLNAVQGLASMVDSYGKDVLKGLMNIYSAGISETSLTPHEINKQTRVGEAIEQVIRRCGTALGAYVDIIVPPLLHMVRASHMPVVLRTSALSLMAECARTSFLHLLPYLDDFVQGMVDLLQTESGPSGSPADSAGEQLDSNPATTDSKMPPLRRAALHFLTLVFRAIVTRIHDESVPDPQLFPKGTIARARTTLSYLASTDDDAIVKVMAREAVEMIDSVAKALLGL